MSSTYMSKRSVVDSKVTLAHPAFPVGCASTLMEKRRGNISLS